MLTYFKFSQQLHATQRLLQDKRNRTSLNGLELDFFGIVQELRRAPVSSRVRHEAVERDISDHMADP